MLTTLGKALLDYIIILSTGFSSVISTYPILAVALIIILVWFLYQSGVARNVSKNLSLREALTLETYTKVQLMIQQHVSHLELKLYDNVNLMVSNRLRSNTNLCPLSNPNSDGTFSCNAMNNNIDECSFTPVSPLGALEVKNIFTNYMNTYQLVLRICFEGPIPTLLSKYLYQSSFEAKTSYQLQDMIDIGGTFIRNIIKKHVDKHKDKAPCILNNMDLAGDNIIIRDCYHKIAKEYMIIRKQEKEKQESLDKKGKNILSFLKNQLFKIS